MTRQLLFPFLGRERREVFQKAWQMVGQIDDLSKWEIVIRPAKTKRTLEQNAKMWAMLTDISEQLTWLVDGRLQKLDQEEWKDILTAGLKQELRVAAGINGGMVLLGRRTRNMTTKEMAELIELMNAFGAERGVRYSCPEDSVPDYYTRSAA